MSVSQWRGLLGITMAATMVAVFCLSYFYEGTSIGKYFSGKAEVERVNDAAALDYADALLFDDAQREVDLEMSIEETSDAEAGFLKVQKIRDYDRGALLVLTALSLLVLFPWLYRSRWAAVVYLILGAYLFLLAYYKSVNGGSAFTDLAILAHGTRWLGALALALWLWQVNGREQAAAEQVSAWVLGMLVVSASMTFMSHGAEAFMLHPGFVDLLMSGAENLWIPMSEQVSRVLLKLIGLMDIALALFILSRKNRKLLMWMAFWGGVAAFSRVVAHGSEFWLETLLRTANFSIPLMLAYLYCPAIKPRVSSSEKLTADKFELKSR